MKKLKLSEKINKYDSIAIYYESSCLFCANNIATMSDTHSLNYHHDNAKRQRIMGKTFYSIKYFVNFIGMEYFNKICEE